MSNSINEMSEELITIVKARRAAVQGKRSQGEYTKIVDDLLGTEVYVPCEWCKFYSSDDVCKKQGDPHQIPLALLAYGCGEGEGTFKIKTTIG